MKMTKEEKKEYMRKWCEEHREQIREYERKNYEKRKEQHRKRQREKRHGIEAEPKRKLTEEEKKQKAIDNAKKWAKENYERKKELNRLYWAMMTPERRAEINRRNREREREKKIELEAIRRGISKEEYKCIIEQEKAAKKAQKEEKERIKEEKRKARERAEEEKRKAKERKEAERRWEKLRPTAKEMFNGGVIISRRKIEEGETVKGLRVIKKSKDKQVRRKWEEDRKALAEPIRKEQVKKEPTRTIRLDNRTYVEVPVSVANDTQRLAEFIENYKEKLKNKKVAR